MIDGAFLGNMARCLILLYQQVGYRDAKKAGADLE